MPRVSVIIPARNERFLVPTVQDVLTKAAGEIEILVVLDGYWPDPPLPADSRIRVLHYARSRGMRPAINAAVQMSRGAYLMKLDAHCMLAEGFDTVLVRDHSDDWIVVPRRYRLDPEQWCFQEVGKPPVDAHFLSYPFERPGDTSCGLHGTIWKSRAKGREHILIDEEMSSQGSCWFMTRRHWDWLGPMDVEHYGNFIQEFQEIGCKTWLGGGQVMVNKQTWMAHLHKGTKYGRGYTMQGTDHARGRDFCTDYWLHDRWPKATRTLRWLIERFWPVPSWPVTSSGALDWDRVVQDRDAWMARMGRAE